jgi:hypothetical protein
MSNEIATSVAESQKESEVETETKAAVNIRTIDLPNISGVELDDRILQAIPEHSKLDKLGLEKSIVDAGGCTNPVKVGKKADGSPFLVDGLFRIETCRKHSLPLPQGEVIEGLQSQADAINYRIDLHLNRRNMTPRWVAYLWGDKYNQLKKLPHRQKSNDIEKSSTEVPQNEGDTSEQLALAAGVGHATISRFSQFAGAINKLSAIVGHDFARALLNAEIRLSKNDIIRLSKMSEDDITAIAELLKEDSKLKLEEAIQKVHLTEPPKEQSNDNGGDDADDEKVDNYEDKDETQGDDASQEAEEDGPSDDSNSVNPDEVLEKMFSPIPF